MKKRTAILLIFNFIIIIVFIVVNKEYQNKIATEKNELLKNTEKIICETYTTETYNKYIKAKEKAIKVINNKFATLKEIENAKNSLILTFKQLKIAKRVKYIVSFEVQLITNDSVGNDWNIIYKTKDKVIKNNSEFIFNLNEIPKFYCEIIETDKFPDIGITEFIFNDNKTSITNKLEIFENRGKYINNVAVWEIGCNITVTEYL